MTLTDLQKDSSMNPPKNISTGDFCIAQYQLDNEFYRAQVMEKETRENKVIINRCRIKKNLEWEFFPRDSSYVEVQNNVLI